MKKFLVLGLLLTMLALMSSTVMAEEVQKNSWGVGMGIPYGGIMGVNIDHNIIPNADLSLGLGIFSLSGITYNVGVKFYLAPEEESIRPRVSCYYGTNTTVALYDEWGFLINATNYNGFSIGIGASVYWGHAHQNGMDFDLIYIASSEVDVEQLEAEGYDTSGFGGIKVSVGYRRYF